MRLYGEPRGSGLRCHWLLHELELQYETKYVDFQKGEHRSPEFLQMNPMGQVPVLVDGDFVLTESLAINDYIAGIHKPELLGKDPQENSLMWQWSLWTLFTIQRHLGDAFVEKNYGAKDPKVIDTALAKLPRYLNVLNNMLSTREYILGDTFTMADINIAAAFSYATAIEYGLAEYPHIEVWLKRMTDRTAYKSALAAK